MNLTKMHLKFDYSRVDDGYLDTQLVRLKGLRTNHSISQFLFYFDCEIKMKHKNVNKPLYRDQRQTATCTL